MQMRQRLTARQITCAECNTDQCDCKTGPNDFWWNMSVEHPTEYHDQDWVEIKQHHCESAWQIIKSGEHANAVCVQTNCAKKK